MKGKKKKGKKINREGGKGRESREERESEGEKEGEGESERNEREKEEDDPIANLKWNDIEKNFLKWPNKLI